MINIISMLNSIISDIKSIELFDNDSNWIIDMIPTLSTYNCIRGYISGSKLNKILKKTNLIQTLFYKIIIYIDDLSIREISPYSLNIIYFDTEKQLEKNIDIFNLCSLLKSYTVIKDSIEIENMMYSKL
jgi:hypothetical protein